MLDFLMQGRHLPEAGLAAVTGVTLFARGFRRLRTARRIENTPTARVRSLPMGSVEVVGTAWIAEPTEAPFSAKPSAYWEVEVEEYRPRKNRSSWVTIRRETSPEPFWVDDDTGRVMVLPATAETHLPIDLRLDTGGWRDVPAHVDRRLAGWKLSSRRRLRLSERRLDLGALTYVYGVAQERPDLRREKAQRINERLRQLRSDPQATRGLDTDGDDRVSDEEWETARRSATEAVQREGVEDRIVIAAGRSGEMFVISDRSESDLIQRLKWQSGAFVFGGAALAIGAATWVLWTSGLLG